MCLLSVENIYYGYDEEYLLKGVGLKVRNGDFILLRGLNGSGKTTFIKIIYQVLPVIKDGIASIKFMGKELIGVDVCDLLKMGIMYVPQDNSLFDSMSVKENLMFSVMHDASYKKKKADERIGFVFEELPYLFDISKRKARYLSGGEKKLVSIGMVLMNDVKLLLIDEPLAGVSTENSILILEKLKSLSVNGASIIIIEHKSNEVMPYINRVCEIKGGFLEEKNSIN